MHQPQTQRAIFFCPPIRHSTTRAHLVQHHSTPWVAALLLGALLGVTRPVWAEQGGHSTAVFVRVPEVLSVMAAEPILLRFDAGHKDTLSTTQEVMYRVKANHLAGGSLEEALVASVETPMPGTVLRANVRAYANRGTRGNATLTGIASGFHQLTSGQTPLAKKRPGQGQQDHVLNGEVAIAWQAVLTEDHPRTPFSYAPAVTLTLRDGH